MRDNHDVRGIRLSHHRAANRLRAFLLIAMSYAVGSLVGAYYITRLRTGGDIRLLGSGNAGAHNVWRSGDRQAATLTLLFDAAKAALVVWLAQHYSTNAVAGLAYLAVVVGHVAPFQLGFRGGKGVAPALGGMIALDWYTAMGALAMTGSAFLGTRSLRTAGLVSIALAPGVFLMLRPAHAAAAAVFAVCVLVLLAHHPEVDRRRAPRSTGQGTATSANRAS